MKKAIDFFTAHPARFFLLAALLWGGFMCFLNYKDGAEFSWHDLLVEANGMVFDLLVFGVLLSIYEALREKRDKIERLKEEIDDYRGWNEEEAAYRIIGAVKRLNNLKVSNLNLSRCFLKGADFMFVHLERANLGEANLEGANLKWASLDEANLYWVKLKQADLSSAKLKMTNLQGAKLEGAKLEGANLEGANLEGANLEGANLEGANLRGANLEGANLEGAYVDGDWFEKLEKWNARGRKEIKAKYFIDKYRGLKKKQ